MDQEKNKRPFSIYVDRTYTGADDKKFMLHLLLMIKDFTGAIPKKVNASVYYSSPQKAIFKNIQLDYKDGSTIGFRLTNVDGNTIFKSAFFMQDLFAEFDFQNNHHIGNGKQINVPDVDINNETDDFLNAVISNKQAVTGLEHLLETTQVYGIMEEKLHRFRND